MPYRYQGTQIQTERQAKNRDHCPDSGEVYELAELMMDGVAMNPIDKGSRLSTPPLRRDSGRRWIYGVGPSGTMRVAPDGDRGEPSPQVKHETLFHNADLDAAGEIEFNDGVVADLNDLSGSYGTENDLQEDGEIGRRFRDAVRRALAQAGALMAPGLAEKLNG